MGTREPDVARASLSTVNEHSAPRSVDASGLRAPVVAVLRRMTRWEFVLWLLGRRTRLRVVGHSMEPLLTAGDVVFVRARRREEVPTIGSVVAATCVGTSEGEGRMDVVKMVSDVRGGDRRVLLTGFDVSDSAHFIGWVEIEQVWGIATSRFPKQA